MEETQVRTAAHGERKRVEVVVQTLAALQNQEDTLAAVAHDARTMVAALTLYCDLLEEPGVLGAGFGHYGSELRLVAAASCRLVEKLMALDPCGARPASFWLGKRPEADAAPARRSTAAPPQAKVQGEMATAAPVEDLAEELLATRNLLAALAGPAIAVTVDAPGGARPAPIRSEDLTRVLVNLVRNAAEAMPSGGRIHIRLGEDATEDGAGGGLRLTVEDNGPGIAPESLEKIFEPGYSEPAAGPGRSAADGAARRGLGLSIARSIVEGSGGRIFAEHRAGGGARIVLEWPAGKPW